MQRNLPHRGTTDSAVASPPFACRRESGKFSVTESGLVNMVSDPISPVDLAPTLQSGLVNGGNEVLSLAANDSEFEIRSVG
jgi:hypothetical protein